MNFSSRVFLLLIFWGGGFFRIPAVAQEIQPFKAVFRPAISQQETEKGYLTTVRIEMPEGYYLYAQKTSPELPVSAAAVVTKSPVREKNDPYFGAVQIYDHEHPAVFTISQPNPQDHYLLKAQGCKEDVICYPPEEWLLSVAAGGPVDSGITQEKTSAISGFQRLDDKNFLRPKTSLVPATNPNPEAAPSAQTVTTAISSSAVSTSATAVAARLNRSYWLTLPWLILIGIGVSFSACVYPLIPIVTNLVVGSHASPRRSYALIATYVLAMAASMALLGAVFGYFQINIQIVLQKPPIVIAVAIFFALLSLAMFGLFNLQAPGFLGKAIDRIVNSQKIGSFSKAGVMGGLSMLIVSPCATPVLTALLLYTTQTTPIKGALALFCFGLGSGLPLFLFASVLRRFMPRAGIWMIAVKYLFAFLLLAVAVWLLGRILPSSGALIVWTLYAFAIAFFVAKERRIFGLGFFPHVLSGAASITAIVLAFQAFNQKNEITLDEGRHAQFQAVDNAQTLARTIARSEKTVIVDFTADWCVICRIQEQELWRNPRFIGALQDYRLIKVDVTDFTSAHRTLFRTLNIIGPPVVLFYPAGGELKNPAKTVIGALSADTFASLLQNFASGG